MGRLLLSLLLQRTAPLICRYAVFEVGAVAPFTVMDFFTDGEDVFFQVVALFLGVLRNTPAAGEYCEIAYDGVMRLTANGATAIFDPLTLDSGQWDVSADGEVVRALALMAAGAAGDIFTGNLFALPHGATLADLTTYFEGH